MQCPNKPSAPIRMLVLTQAADLGAWIVFQTLGTWTAVFLLAKNFPEIDQATAKGE